MTIKKLANGMEYVKATSWKEDSLRGTWIFTRKLDGVRVFKTESGWISRASKPLYNLDHVEAPVGASYEVFNQSWEDSITLVRTSVNGSPCPSEHLYRLDVGHEDQRLIIGEFTNPSKELIEQKLQEALDRGDEGLILRHCATKPKWLKVKPKATADVRITGYVEGKGKHVGRLGLFKTSYGSVGTGFTDAQREEFWLNKDATVGQIIEVEYMELTNANKMRHPRFLRERFDKDTESFD